VLRVVFDVFNLLFIVKHLPALSAQHLSVGFRFNLFDLLNEGIPLLAVHFYHLI
jgi:hypothetical protein